MKRMTKWMFFALALTAATAVGCTDDEPEDQVLCERTEIDGTAYCTYQQQITETGYDCPQDLPNPIPFEGHTVCSGEEEIPQEHEEPIREHIANSSSPDLDGGDAPKTDGPGLFGPDVDAGTGNTMLMRLCNDPQAYDGQTVTLDGNLIETVSVGTTRGCGEDAGGGCCNAVVTAFVLACDRNQVGNVDTDTAIVLVADENAGFEYVQGEVVTNEVEDLASLVEGKIRMGCVGQECYEVCGPAAPSEISSFTGTFRTGGSFTPDTEGGVGDPPGIYERAVEVTSVDVAE